MSLAFAAYLQNLSIGLRMQTTVISFDLLRFLMVDSGADIELFACVFLIFFVFCYTLEMLVYI